MIKNEHISRYIGILANRLRREIDALASCGEYSGGENSAFYFGAYGQRNLPKGFGGGIWYASVIGECVD